MSYVLPEKQREYQRAWWIRKKEQHRRGKWISTGVVTWEQLNSNKTISKIHTWKECVLECQKSIVGRKTNRIRIAELALRACVIKHGGRADPDRLTIKKFSEEIGINHKTLNDWITVKRLIFDAIDPKDVKKMGFDFTAARTAVEFRFKEPNDNGVIGLYKKYSSCDPASRASRFTVRYLFDALSHLRKHRIKHFTDDDLEKVKSYIKEISSIINE